MLLSNLKKVHCVGIGGIGVSAVAKLLHFHGIKVSGTDLEHSFIIDELKNLGIDVKLGHKEQNVPADADLVIYSPAVPLENVERALAKKLNIQQLSYAEFLGELSRTLRTIAVSGTHGKSTVTAMVGLILEAAGFDPTVIVGSHVPSFKYGNVRVGSSKWLVVEACEHQGNMRLLSPYISVITYIEEDHLDFYKDINDIAAAFQSFVNATDNAGLVVYNADEVHTRGLDFSKKRAQGFSLVNSELETALKLDDIAAAGEAISRNVRKTYVERVAGSPQAARSRVFQRSQ
jgi:UDP-N-acetylmuramate--alanine ligase